MVENIITYAYTMITMLEPSLYDCILLIVIMDQNLRINPTHHRLKSG